MASATETLAAAPDPMSALQTPSDPSMAQPQEGAPMPQGPPQTAPEAPQSPPGPPEQNVAEGASLDPKTQQKVESYVSVLMNELHSPDTRDDVLEILKSSKDPYMTVPQAAMTINDQAQSKITKQGGRVDTNTMFLASQYLVSDLMEIGNTFGVFKVGQEDFKELYQDSLQMYIQRGLKDKSIDPIELQTTAEKFMTDNEKIGGHYLAEKQGLPFEPQTTQMMAQVEQKTTAKVQAQEADRRSQEAKQQMDQQARSALLAQGGQ